MKKAVTILVVLISLTCQSQNQDIRFEKISAKEGLSSQLTNCIFQDHLGFIWIGTAFGLNRFDGISCKTYYHNKKDSNSLVNNEVLSIAEDKDNKLWIGTQEGISCFDPGNEQFINYSAAGKGVYYFPRENCFTYIDKLDNVWIGHNTGLAMINDRSAPMVNMTLQLSPPGRSINQFVISFLEDSKARFWISTSYGVQQIDRKKFSVIAHYFGDDKNAVTCRQIVEDRTGRIFVGTWGSWIYSFDEIKNEFIKHHLQGGNAFEIIHCILPITESGTDYLLLGTESGLIKVSTKELLNDGASFNVSVTNKLNPSSISNGLITDLFTDRSGNTWISTQEGVNKIDPHKQQIRNFPITADLSNYTSPTNIVEDLDDMNKLWVVSGGTLFSYDKTTKQFSSLKRIEGMGSSGGLAKGKNNYWIATSRGLLQCDRKMNLINLYRKGSSLHDLSTDWLYSVYEDHEGKVWIGTANKGINVLDPSTGLIRKYLDDSTTIRITSFVNQLLEDSRHNIWIATTGGLYRYDREQDEFKAFRTNQQSGYAAKSDNILSLYESKDGKIWIGSREGLRWYSYKEDRFNVVNVDDNKLSDYISGIIEDEKGILWLATNNGLIQYNVKENSFRSYSTLNGLPTNDLTFAFERDQTGNIFIGVPGQLTMIDPLKFVPNEITRPAIITSIAIDDHSVPFSNKKIRIRYDQSITFNFISLNYSNSDNNSYAYQLSGFNNDWINIGNNRSLLLPGLPPGKYTLNLKAANNDGIWDKEITHLSFIVTPPFWKTWWFIGLLILVTGSLIYIAYRYRLNQLLRMEKMRTRIATDLHDDIGATLSSISFYSEAVRQKAKEKLPEVTLTLEKMGETSRRMVTSMSDIVWAIDPKNDDMEKMLQRMKLYAAELCSIKNINLQVDVDDKINNLKPGLEQRKNIYMVFKEALNNALKYSNCQTILLSLQHTGNQLTLQVADDGKGFDSNLDQGGNGLPNMKRRAAEMGGHLTILSSGKGTTVELIIKIT